mmetsp:Transcript_25233/g.51338  ORF Transcript_25233/g.51338 Transcript_25233/m.51338 type:complete len:209 (-) Transcript_25233:1144-1770(-)
MRAVRRLDWFKGGCSACSQRWTRICHSILRGICCARVEGHSWRALQLAVGHGLLLAHLQMNPLHLLRGAHRLRCHRVQKQPHPLPPFVQRFNLSAQGARACTFLAQHILCDFLLLHALVQGILACIKLHGRRLGSYPQSFCTSSFVLCAVLLLLLHPLQQKFQLLPQLHINVLVFNNIMLQVCNVFRVAPNPCRHFLSLRKPQLPLCL